jgi:hypothetical protein
MDDQQSLETARAVIVKAMESRRELVAYSKLEAIEMDRYAREVERAALEEVGKLLPNAPAHEQLYQVKSKLHWMEQQLQELDGRKDIQERSRALERDEITWRTFEDISWLLGVA